MDWDLQTGGGLSYLQRSNERRAERLAARLVGRRLGHYRVEARIGWGGMAVVFRGSRIDQTFDRAVAIKVLPGVGTTAGQQSRFARERRILAGLNDPRIAHLYDAGQTEEGWPYFVMELIDGVAIDDYCRTHHADPNDVARLVREVALALQYAHERSVIHRDIKPSNILVDAQGQLKLLDFGVAKVLAEDATMTVQGMPHPLTPSHASPEQVLGERVSPKSDLYQLGQLLYELLAGRRLFEDQTLAAAVARATATRPPDLPPDAVAAMPKALRAIVRRCLQPQPRKRPADAMRIIEALDGFLRDDRRTTRRRRMPGRRRLLTVSMAVVLAASILVNVWLLLG